MGLDLGRVQGAGWFHTSAASSTSISVSSLQPQLTPFVGDAVLFPNGDVRQIIGVSGSTVTLGDVLYSVKGDPGIGNATLSGVYGNSTENGYTQEAVNGAAQAKNYYNQAVYDSSVSNGDGTATVPRKSGFLKYDGSESWKQWSGATSYYISQPDDMPTNTNGFEQIPSCKLITNLLPVRAPISLNTGSKGISVGNNWRVIIIDAETKANLSSNPLYIEYEVAENYQYTEQVIENQPIRPANQEEEWYWHEEWRKGLNLYNRLPTITTIKNSNLILSKLKPNTTYCIFVSSSENYDYSTSHWYIKDETVPVTILDGIQPNRKYTFTTGSNVSYINFIRWGTPPNLDAEVRIMITEGIHTYPFETYNGKILHEKDLSGVQLFPEGVNPAQTIGGDWEDKGTVTTSDNTVFHAYRRLS